MPAREGGEQTHGYSLPKAAETHAGRDNDANAVGIHGVNRLNLREGLLQHLEQRNRGVQRHQIVDFRPRDTQVKVLENRVVAIGYCRNLHDGLQAGAGIRAGKFAKRTLALTKARLDITFENNFAAGGDIQIQR